MGATATESKQFFNISANTAAFALKGGKYALVLSGTITDLRLQTLSLDGTTWIDVGIPLGAAGLYIYDLPPGQYRISIGTSTGVYAAMTSIPT